MNKTKKSRFALFISITLFVFAFTIATNGQDDRGKFDKSTIPDSATKASQFVPKGWKIEEEIKGDVNNDNKPDLLLKLVEDKTKETKNGSMIDRERALVIAVADGGTWKKAAVADKLLQCTGCGGAFYGVVDAPAYVKVVKGVIVVNQDHGSRETSEVTLRFRLEKETGRFLLIGFDYAESDRLDGSSVTESTNYVTGTRITTFIKRRKPATKKTQIAKTKMYIDDVDYEELEGQASERVG